MSFAHEDITALPVATPADKALIRAMCTRRFAYCLASSESATSFVAADSDTGLVPLYLIQNNIMFQYDSTDSTTANDGVTCLVSSDGKRFKAATITPPYSVLTKGTVAEPGSPSVGDAYLIPTAATGADWSGKDAQIGIFTAAGWRFATSPIGRFLYVKDETAFYHRNASGNWTAGVGSIVLGANSVNITNVLGAAASFVVKVENQTTNAPPVAPVAPVAYIIGPSPTGSWAGNAGKVAACLVNGSFTIISPVNGDEVFDKSQSIVYRFNGTAWISAQGIIIGGAKVLGPAGRLTVAGGTLVYSPSTVVPPSTQQCDSDPTTLTYSAKATGNFLQFTYQATCNISSANTLFIPALIQDSIVSAVDWQFVDLSNTIGTLFVILSIFAPDALSHIYTLRFFHGTNAVSVTSVGRSTFKVEEYAP